MKAFLKKIRDRLFLNSVNSCVRNSVREEMSNFAEFIAEKLAIHLLGGGCIRRQCFRKSEAYILSSTAGIIVSSTAQKGRYQSACGIL